MKILAALMCALPLLAQNHPRVILRNIRLIDGTGRPPVARAAISIRDGNVEWVSTTTFISASSDTVLDLSGKTVMPGIINGHGHLGLTQGTSVSPANYTRENIEHQLAQYDRYGITTMMSLGMNKDLIYSLRAEQQQGRLGGATILTAGRGIGTPGGVPGVNVGADQLYRPATPEEARHDMREMAAHQPDLIKIWVDDNLHKSPEPNPAVYGAAISEARKLNLRVAVHVYYLADAKRVIRDGANILAHSIRDQPVDQEAIDLIKSRHVYYIPTLQLEESFFIYAQHPVWTDAPFFKNAVNPALEQQLNSAPYRSKIEQDPTTAIHRQALQTAMANLKRLFDAGVLVAFGTDSGANPYRIQGFAEHRELELMVKSGLTPLQAIHTATQENARMLHIDNVTGTIEPGKQADLIVLDADPSIDITNTRKIAMIFHHGKQVKPE